ncbi:MAG: PQQ-binding-like beta-propeller repeat protein [Clostridia bacterium]|nr:PQQ-binding-like beta-propeller repeat protein [Clostridia bacterium]
MKKGLKIVACVLCMLCLSHLGSAAEQGMDEITLQLERKQGPNEYEVFGVIKAYQNGSVLWEFTTPAGPMTELSVLSDIYRNGNAVYLSAHGSFYALDVFTGELKWKVNDVGASNSIVFDAYGNVYISGYYGPNVMAVSSNGNLLYREADASYGWVDTLEIEGDILRIHYGLDMYGEADDWKTLDISQFRPTQNTSTPTTGTDYVAVFGAFIRDGLKQFLSTEYKTCSVENFKDCYMVDMNNDTVPELFCVFSEEWGSTYAVLVGYDGTFTLGKEYPFNFMSGSAGTERYRVLRANGKYYFETYFSARQDWESPDGTNSWKTENTITIQEGGQEYAVYHYSENYGTVHVNGEEVKEWAYDYVEQNYEIVVDGSNYGGFFTYEPQFGADYEKFWDTPAPQTPTASVTLNGYAVQFDQLPVIINGRTLVPVRAVVEKMGGTVLWLPETQTAVLELDGNRIELTIDNTTALLNGEAKALDVPPQIIGERTLMPIRFIAESFGFAVAWDDETKTVIITKAADSEAIYKNVQYGYQLTFPESWAGYYKVMETEDGGVRVCFVGKSTASKAYADTPMFMILPQATVETEEYLDSVRKIGTANGIAYYYATGTSSALYLFDLVQSGRVSNRDREAVQNDLEMQTKITNESSSILFTPIAK